ncbi:hypothetical protein [Kribbella italica]|uniref:Uncharacterized protein n=1 Tax=Kribbella italica TaxID=1540520 RepID=A0A7W9MRR0_9ACTN|nr:hypothetical protein [Kribbella italica]MBB5833387.1 hypothetical protein [Kribbella italica]
MRLVSGEVPGEMSLEHEDGTRERINAVVIGDLTHSLTGFAVEFRPVGDDLVETVRQAKKVFRVLAGRDGTLQIPSFSLEVDR